MEYELNEQNIKNVKLNTLFYNTINTLTNALEELLQSKKIQEVYGKIYNSSITYDSKKMNYRKHPKNNFKFSFNKQYKIKPSNSILSKRKRHYEDIIYKESKSQRLSNYLSNHLREMNVQSYPDSHFQAEKNSKLNYDQKKYYDNENFNKNSPLLTQNQQQKYNLNLLKDKNVVNDLNGKFNYDLYINRSVESLYQWMEYQKEKLGMNEEEYKKEWEQKKKKLEYNISIFENSVLKDSYDDMRSIIQEIILTLEFLSGGCVEELQDLIPAWKNSHYYIFSALNYIQIIEDMKEFISTSYEMNESLDIFIFNLKEMIKDKKEKYGDILKTNGKYWRSMCFPFNENLILEVKNRIYSYLYISHLKINQILDENNIYQCNYDPKNIHSLYLLKSNNIIILNSSTSKTKNEAQYFALFENCIQILKILNITCNKNSEIFFNMLNINVTNKYNSGQFNPFNKFDDIYDQIEFDNDQYLLKLRKLSELLPQIITELGINLFLQIPNINNISRIKMSISLSYKYIKAISEIIAINLEKINEIRRQERHDKEEFIFNNITNTLNLQNETTLSKEQNTKNFNFDDSDGLILNSTSSSCSSYIDNSFDFDWRVSNKNSIINDAKVNDTIRYYLKINYDEIHRIQQIQEFIDESN
ncbi:hypothetical protein LY90DRAFT_508454 [Neocallimastix californiae]|uniref:Uncharacterized protein n=1 Tax=Neocallimastix californiae TaxID=1754190 RepID=A0A1Y2CWA5_9FUNG|nr:hypothetical protein LY90DRAFT_508454 [Neocallimastix californiae]|eukprot:ORY50625.1 hypothetical protein LY90DRAFT_508454 [Neocallimastix californiae]